MSVTRRSVSVYNMQRAVRRKELPTTLSTFSVINITRVYTRYSSSDLLASQKCVMRNMLIFSRALFSYGFEMKQEKLRITSTRLSLEKFGFQLFVVYNLLRLIKNGSK